MKIALYLYAVILTVVVKIVTANVLLQRSPQHYCGSRLADMMKLLCATKYNFNEPTTTKPSKRAIMDMYMWDYSDLTEDYNEIDYPFRPKPETVPSFVMMQPPPSSRLSGAPSKRKIIDECCHKPCYVSELRSYCAI